MKNKLYFHDHQIGSLIEFDLLSQKFIKSELYLIYQWDKLNISTRNFLLFLQKL